MRRCAVLVGVFLLVAMTSSAAQAADPKVTMEQHCFPAGSGLTYGINIEVSRLPAKAPFTLKLDNVPLSPDLGGGSIGPAQFTADEAGEFGPFGFGIVGVPSHYTLTMVYAGKTFTRTATSTCQPIMMSQCAGDNWQASSRFQDKADCQAFVRQNNGRK